MSEYKAQLLAVEAKLVKDPENEDLLSLKADLEELIEGLEEDEEDEEDSNMELVKNSRGGDEQKSSNKTKDFTYTTSATTTATRAYSSKSMDSQSDKQESGNLDDKNSKRPFSEAELLAKKKEKNRKKKAKLRERIREQLDIAESEKQSWQSFANKKGLKGVTKKSIFASPCSVTGKVGVGTNGIADAPSAAVTKGGAPVAANVKRKH